MQGEAIGEVAIAGIARRIDTHPTRWIASAERDRRVAVAGDTRSVAVGVGVRKERA